MKRNESWHNTPVGAVVFWLGSIQFAVPILIMVALALAWGTYLESTQDARVARGLVYGSWWFMALMGLICVSLIFAVVTRYPWKLKHVGFIVVHASLVTMIVAGFISLLGRIEGHIALEQGMASGTVEMDEACLELVEHDAGQFRTIGEIEAPGRPGTYQIAGFPIEVTNVWDNVKEEFDITDDGTDPYRAVQIQFGPMEQSAVWIGDEARGEAPVIDGVRVRVLASGADWKAPEPKAPDVRSTYTFVVGDQKVPLAEQGKDAFAGWKVVGVKRFSHATVLGNGLAEDPGQKHNPAIEVTISDGKGTTEVHMAFESFPDMIIARTVEGAAKSGAKLIPPTKPSVGGGEETLVIYGTPPAMKLGFVGRDGSVKTLEHPGPFPWNVDLGTRKIVMLKQFTKTREQSRFSPIPSAKEHRPALVIKSRQGVEQAIAWKGTLPFSIPGRIAMLRFRPRTVSLPFSMKLNEFRKMDYPGTDMAMEYESAVTVMLPDASEKSTTISMNNPLVQSGWKVYQSGFMGNTVSIFSVMRDPGLTLTYIASVFLCLGIVVTFYGSRLSWGHPGIPTPFSGKEASHAPVSSRSDSVVDPSVHRPRGVPDLEPAISHAADPGRRAGDAPRHVRA